MGLNSYRNRCLCKNDVSIPALVKRQFFIIVQMIFITNFVIFFKLVLMKVLYIKDKNLEAKDMV